MENQEPRNLEIGGPRRPTSTVNWRALAMLAMGIPLIAGGATAAKMGLTTQAGIAGLVVALGALVALVAMQRAGFNPPADYAREARERAAAEDQDKGHTPKS